jgi:hypothetical protein
MKKSVLLVVLPYGVVTEIGPDPTLGAAVAILVAVEELTEALVRLNFTLLFAAVV